MKHLQFLAYLTQGTTAIVNAGDNGHVSCKLNGVVPIIRNVEIEAIGRIASPYLVFEDTNKKGMRGNPSQVLYDQLFAFPMSLSPSRMPKNVITE